MKTAMAIVALYGKIMRTLGRGVIMMTNITMNVNTMHGTTVTHPEMGCMIVRKYGGCSKYALCCND